MSLSTLSINTHLWTNHDEQPMEKYEGDPGLIEVERFDENEVAVHFRHVNDTSAIFSGCIDRPGAIALAEVLRAVAAE